MRRRNLPRCHLRLGGARLRRRAMRHLRSRMRLLVVCFGCAHGMAPSPTHAAPAAERAHAEPAAVANPFSKYLFGGRVAAQRAVLAPRGDN